MKYCKCGHSQKRHNQTLMAWNPGPFDKTHIENCCADLRCGCRVFTQAEPGQLWNVSYMATALDNGACSSFETRNQAEKEAKELKRQGAYHVKIWTA